MASREALVSCGATFEDFVQNVGVLRGYDTLPNDAWETIDETIIREGARLLALVAALPGVPVDDPLGTTEIKTTKVDDITDPVSDMFGESAGDVQAPDFAVDITALPWHYIDLKFPASNTAAFGGLEPLAVEGAIRRLNIYLEGLAFGGLPGTFGGRDFLGVTNAPNVNTTTITNAWNNSGTTGDQMLAALTAMLTALAADGFYGPYVVFVPPATYRNMDRNFLSQGNVTISIRDRLTQVDIQIRQSHGVPSATGVVVVDASGDAARWASPVDPAAVTWTSPAGLTRYAKVITKAAPVVRDTYSGNSGILYGT